MNDGMNRSVMWNGIQHLNVAVLFVPLVVAANCAVATAAQGEVVAPSRHDKISKRAGVVERFSASAGGATSVLAHRPIGADADAGFVGDALLGPFCTVDDCDGQPADSGGDSCDDATPFDLDMGDLQLVCGDSTPAGGQPEECGALAPDYVWWESFTIDECADVLIDYCCTAPVPPTFYIVLSKDCPNCSLIFPTTGDTCVTDDDCVDRPYSHCSANAAGTFACRDFGFGEAGPRECLDGNPSAIWRNLGPGTYYYPLYTCTDPVVCNPIGTAGPYQLHINVLPPFSEPGGCCIPPQDNVTIVGVDSLKTHGLGGLELAIDLLDTAGIEPRRFGPRKLAFEMSNDMDGGTVIAGNVQIDCTVGPAPAINSATLQGARTVVVEIGAMTDLDCCRFAFAGMQSTDGGGVISAFNVRGIQGDMNFSASVTGSDPLLVKPHFGEIAGVDLAAPQWDYDLSGGVTGSDFALIKPRLGNVGASCPAAALAGVTCIEAPCRDACEALGGSFLGHGVPCAGADCLTGACCLDGGRRCEVLMFEECLAQGGSFDGPGADCDPDCICTPDETGADACDDLGEAVFIPSDGTVITFAGDTTLANDIDCPLLDPDLTWWEKIEVDDCVDLRVDACCTDPLLNVIYQVMYGECPCADFVVGSAQFGQVCEDGNADVLFVDVGPGTFYYPVHACVDAEDCGLAISRLGPYQLHMRAEPADLEACCVPDTDECQMHCPRFCRSIGGLPLGDGTDCDAPSPCATGSCCFGHNECQESDLDTCLGMGGRYQGGATCDDGACIVNDLCQDAVLIECNTLTDAYNQFATTNDGEPGYGCHSAGAGTFGVGNVWFKFVATHHTARLNTCESVPPADDSVLAMYEIGDPEDPCNTLTEIGCSDDHAGCIVATGFGSDFIVEGLNIGETYYVQLGCWTEPDRGNYQLRILCPAISGACCFEDGGQFVCQEGFEEEACDAIGGRFGGLNSVCGPPGDPQEMDPPCGAGACCRADDLGFCALLDRAECKALCPECSWQGDGVGCVDPLNPCAGSCCTGDGDECVVTTETACLDDPPGGLGGAIWTRYLACNDPGIDCTNAGQEICAQPGENCHLSDQQGHGNSGTLFVQSDRSQFTQSRVADSFVPTDTPITSECWWGAYANFQQQNPNCTIGDAFRITYYRSDGPSGLPNTVIRQSNVGATKALTGNVFLNAAGNIIPEWEYRGNNHPNAVVTVGDCTWFEVTNDTGFQNCRWYWATSGDGDGLCVVDSNHINGYEVGEERDFDMAWCANVAIQADDCN